MTRPSQSSPACGNPDASLSFADAPGTTADDGREGASRAASAGSDDPQRGHSGGASGHGTDSSSTAGPGRTTSRGRPLDDTDRTRNGGNRDGNRAPRPPKAWTAPPHRRDTRFPGAHTPDLPAVGSPQRWREPPPAFLILTAPPPPARALARDDDADLTDLRKRGQKAVTPRFSIAADTLGQTLVEQRYARASRKSCCRAPGEVLESRSAHGCPRHHDPGEDEDARHS